LNVRLKKYINLTFLDTVKLLGDLSKWIGDLVATKYMNLHVPNDSDSPSWWEMESGSPPACMEQLKGK